MLMFKSFALRNFWKTPHYEISNCRKNKNIDALYFSPNNNDLSKFFLAKGETRNQVKFPFKWLQGWDHAKLGTLFYNKNVLKVKDTAKNTVISPEFLVWKFCGKAMRRLCRSGKFPHQEIKWNCVIFCSDRDNVKQTNIEVAAQIKIWAIVAKTGGFVT